MHPSTISKWFVKFVKDIGLPVINFHGSRHTNATLLISQNIDVAVVAARLGHAQITIAFNFYVHPIIFHNKSARNVLQNLLIPNYLFNKSQNYFVGKINKKQFINFYIFY